MVLNEMVYDPNGSNNSSLLSLVAGTITFVAGETAKHGDMKVDTPVATMGIRGTAVLVEIDFTIPSADPHSSLPSLPTLPPSDPSLPPLGATPRAASSDCEHSRFWSSRTAPPVRTSCSTRPRYCRSRPSIRPDSRSTSATARSASRNAPLSPDVQKLITDVFSLKFTSTDSNTKLAGNFTDTIVPDSSSPFHLANGSIVPILFVDSGNKSSSVSGNSNGPTDVFIPIINDFAPTASATAPTNALIEAGSGIAGVSTSSATVSIADVDGTASFDTAALGTAGWTSTDGGLTYHLAGTYGAATFTVATGVVSYQLDNSKTTTQALTAGTAATDSFVIPVKELEAL